MMREQGFSLVELMVALVSGLLLTAGIIQIFAANKQTYRTIDASSQIQENARIAMSLLGRHIRMTGYRNDSTQSFTDAFASVTFAGYSFSSGVVLQGKDSELAVRYQADGRIRDCEDSTLSAAGTGIVTRFFLDGTDLKCATDLDNKGSQPLLSDVAEMSVRYGVDTDGDGTPERYDRASGVTDWQDVVALRLQLTFQSAEANTGINAGDRLQGTYTTTIALRNLLP